MSTIKELFYKMEYDKVQIKDEPIPLMPSIKIDFKSSVIQANDKLKNDPIYRALIINNTADAFEKEFNSLLQLEINFRYFNKRDAQISVKGFIENLRFYSSYTSCYIDSHKNQKEVLIIPINKYLPLSVLGKCIGNKLCQGEKVAIKVTSNEDISMLLIISFIEETFKKLGYGDHIDIIKGDGFSKSNVKTPMIVFNNADLESASYSAIQAVWGFQGLMSWNVDTIYVQEEVFDKFVTLMKEKLTNITFPHDISKPRLCETYGRQFKNLQLEITKRGFEYWKSHKDEDFSPLLIFNDRLNENNVICGPKYDIPFANVLSFRNAKEAISLANNRKQYFSASIWTENIGLANEVSRKLQCDTVWINSHGQFRPETTCSLYEINFVEGNLREVDIKKSISENIKVQKSWGALPAHKRCLEIRKIGYMFQNNQQKYRDEFDLTEEELNDWIRELINAKPATTNSICDETSDIKSYREPVGVIGLILNDIKLAINIVSNGNILLLDEKEMNNGFSMMISEIGKCFPGIVKFVPYTKLHNLADAVYISSECKNIDVLNDMTSRVKNVWYNFEDSI